MGWLPRAAGRGARALPAAPVALALALLGAPAAVAASPTPTAPPGFACPGELFGFAPAPPRAGATPSPTPAPRPLPTPAAGVVGGRLARGGLQVDLPAGTARPPALRVTAWVVADAQTGAVLAACNAHVPLAPASTLKVLTALALLDAVPPTRRYRATDAEALIDGTRAGMVPGATYSGDDLWHGLLMSSANDCAYALAELTGGQQAAAEALQRTAFELGARDTVVRNTSGLDAPGQVSSAYDLALFGRAALRRPDLMRYAQTRRYAFPDGTPKASRRPTPRPTRSGPPTFEIPNHDRLLDGYPGATGLKNGWTSQAGGSLIATATRGGRSYVVTVLRADTSVWASGTALLDWAFATGQRAAPVGTLDDAPPAAAPGSPPASPTTNPAATNPGATETGGAETGGTETGGRPAGPRIVSPAIAAVGAAALGLGLLGAAAGGYLWRRRR